MLKICCRFYQMKYKQNYKAVLPIQSIFQATKICLQNDVDLKFVNHFYNILLRSQSMKLKKPNPKCFSPLATIEQFAIIEAIWNYTHEIMGFLRKRLKVNSRSFKQFLSDIIKIQSKKMKKVIKSIPIRQKKLLNQNYLHLRLEIFKEDVLKKFKQNYSHFIDKRAQQKLYRRIEYQIIIKVVQLFTIQASQNNERQQGKARKNILKLVVKYRYYFQYNFVGDCDDKIWTQICQVFQNQKNNQIIYGTAQKIQRNDELMVNYLADQMRDENVLRKISYKTLQAQINEFYSQQRQNSLYGRMYKEMLKNSKIYKALQKRSQRSIISYQEIEHHKIEYKIQGGEQMNTNEVSSMVQILMQQSSIQQSEKQQLDEIDNLVQDNTTEQDSREDSSEESSYQSQNDGQFYSDWPQPGSPMTFPQRQFENQLQYQIVVVDGMATILDSQCTRPEIEKECLAQSKGRLEETQVKI